LDRETGQVRQIISINYGQAQLPLAIDEGRVLFDLQPADVPPVPNVGQEIHRTLREPVDSRPLRDLVRPSDQVAIIGDDGTRLTPTDQIIPRLLDELNQGGVPDSDVTLVIATGTHRPMTPGKIAASTGPR
jgi:nickel-dependent lactate racemase